MVLLSQIAPMVLGLLGAQKKNQHIATEDMPMLTSSILGAVGKTDDQGQNSLLNIASQFLDRDNDGSVMDDLGDILGGFMKK